MSRTNLSYFHSVFDLFNLVSWETLAEPERQIAAWERHNRRSFPAALREFYSIFVTMQLGRGQHYRTLSMPELWAEYSNSDEALGVPKVLEHFFPLPHVRIPAPPSLAFPLLWENQGCWIMCARDDGSPDPPIDVSGPCVLSTEAEHIAMVGWHTVGRFSDAIFAWFAINYLEDYTPISYNGVEPRPDFEHAHNPPKPYANGLWLRTSAEPYDPAVLKTLTRIFGKLERKKRPGSLTAHTFSPLGGIIRVTTDEPAAAGALSAWWIHAEAPERLAELARVLLPLGTLRETLRADTVRGRDVLEAIRSE